MTDEEKKAAQAAEQELEKVQQELADLAKKEATTPFAEVAKKAEQAADDKVEKAAEDTGKSEMADTAAERAKDAVDAQQQIAQRGTSCRR